MPYNSSGEWDGIDLWAGSYDSAGDFTPRYTALNSYDSAGNLNNAGYLENATGNVLDERGNLIASSDALNNEDIVALKLNKTDPAKAQELYNLKVNNPQEYYNQLAPMLSDALFASNYNHDDKSPITNAIDRIKNQNPQAYYETKLKNLGQLIGWNTADGRPERNETVYNDIKALLPDALRAGFSTDQINNILGSNANLGNSANAQRIANEASSGNFWADNLKGSLFVLGSALGAGALDAALAPALAAETAGGSYAGMDAAANAYLGGSSGAFVPAEGYSATLPSFGLSGVSPTADQIGDYPMPGEYGTANQWIPSNINPEDVTNLLNYNAAYANGSLSAADLASYANKARQALSTGSSLAKLLGGAGAIGSAGKSALSGVNPQQLGSLLAGGTPQTSNFIGQIKGNQNPFLFNVPGQTQASEGMYDVSGSNMANALRKPYGTNS